MIILICQKYQLCVRSAESVMLFPRRDSSCFSLALYASLLSPWPSAPTTACPSNSFAAASLKVFAHLPGPSIIAASHLNHFGQMVKQGS